MTAPLRERKSRLQQLLAGGGAPLQYSANSDGIRPGFRDDLAHHSDLMSLCVPR
jgi:hypothetical protein